MTSFYTKANAVASANAVETNAVEANAVASANAVAPATETIAYSDVVCTNKRIKKNNITPENIGVIMLSQIPNVSNITAKAIIEKFGTLKCLIDTLTESKSALDMLLLTNKDGKSRKISKPCIVNIYKYLITDTF